MLVVVLILFHVRLLKSFGIPQLDPIFGLHGRDFFLDGVVRFPLATRFRGTPDKMRITIQVAILSRSEGLSTGSSTLGTKQLTGLRGS